MLDIIIYVVGFILVFVLLTGLKIVRPTQRGVIERFGKYTRTKEEGITWIIPFVDTMRKVPITEQMVDAAKQEIITKDNLNATVDAQIYFKVTPTEVGVKRALYKVQDYKWQIVNLARTTLRDVIGNLTLVEANSKRSKLNTELAKTLSKETGNWGIEIVRTELKEIEPPEDVQETMNKVVKSKNEKLAAVDYATARETVADGERRADIKRADGQKQAEVLVAEGKAKSIELVNVAAKRYFIGNAQKLKSLEVTQSCLENNTKIVVPEGSELINIINDAAGTKLPNIVPIIKKGDKKDSKGASLRRG